MPVPVLSAGCASPRLNHTTKSVPLSKRTEQVQRSDGTSPRSHGLEGVEPGYEPRWRCSRTQTLTPLGCLRPRAVPKLLRCLLLKDVCSWPSELAPLLPRLHNPKSSGFLVSAGGGRQLPPSPAGLPHSWAFRISWKKGSGLPVPEGVRPSWVPGPLSVSPTASHLSGGFLRPSCLGLSPCVLALFPFCGSFYLSLSSLQHLHPPLCRYVQQPSSCLPFILLWSFLLSYL